VRKARENAQGKRSTWNDAAVIARLSIGAFDSGDEDDLFRAFAAVVEEGGGYPQEPPTSREEFRAIWVDGPETVRVAKLGGDFAGAYYLKPNFPGRASHIANAGYLVEAGSRGRGIGEALVLDSIEEAPKHGFRALMFNLVFESNPAYRLYERLGFEQIGRVPDAGGGEGARIYWRAL
jgi:ribosomal protein S18 acetylase RimI-like enzyme